MFCKEINIGAIDNNGTTLLNFLIPSTALDLFFKLNGRKPIEHHLRCTAMHLLSINSCLKLNLIIRSSSNLSLALIIGWLVLKMKFTIFA